MALYLIMYAVFALCGYLCTDEDNWYFSVPYKGRTVHVVYDKVYLFVSMLVMWFLCANRSVLMGTDTVTYVNTFSNEALLDRTIDGNTKFELGFRILVRLLRVFTLDPHWFLIVTSTIMFVGTYIFIRNNCRSNYAIGVLIFSSLLFYVYFSAMRESIAIAIAINSLPYIRERKLIKASILIVAGALFHNIALILFVFILLSLKEWNVKSVFITVAISAVGVLLFDTLISIVFKYFPIYARYWGSDKTAKVNSSVGMFAILVAVLCIYTIYEIKVLGKEADTFIITALVGSILCLVINLIGRQYGLLSRLTRFFIPYVIVLASYIYTGHEHSRKKLIYIAISLLMGVYLYTILSNDTYHITPYQFYSSGGHI